MARSSALRASLAALPVAARSAGGSSATVRSMLGSSALRPRYWIRTFSRVCVSVAVVIARSASLRIWSMRSVIPAPSYG